MRSFAITELLSQTRTQKLGILLFGCLTALTARITVDLPFTPVPITLQVLSVLLAGLVLGAQAGAASQMLYLVASAVGLPLSARGLGGLAAFLSPTAGYLLAFIPATFIVGWLARFWGQHRFVSQFIASLAGVLVIYLGGTAWLAMWTQGGLITAWQLGAMPFIWIDGVKAILAALAARSGRALLTTEYERGR